MAQKIPLNKFKSLYLSIPVTPTPSFVYIAQVNRATILLNCQATNATQNEQTVSLYVSAGIDVDGGTGGGFYPVVENLPIPPYDARSLVTGRLVLRGKDNTFLYPDSLFVKASNPGLTLSLGLLEAVNKD